VPTNSLQELREGWAERELHYSDLEQVLFIFKLFLENSFKTSSFAKFGTGLLYYWQLPTRALKFQFQY